MKTGPSLAQCTKAPAWPYRKKRRFTGVTVPLWPPGQPPLPTPLPIGAFSGSGSSPEKEKTGDRRNAARVHSEAEPGDSFIRSKLASSDDGRSKIFPPMNRLRRTRRRDATHESSRHQAITGHRHSPMNRLLLWGPRWERAPDTPPGGTEAWHGMAQMRRAESQLSRSSRHAGCDRANMLTRRPPGAQALGVYCLIRNG